MRYSAPFFVLALAVGPIAAIVFTLAAPVIGVVSAGESAAWRRDVRDEICGTQVLHADGTYESGVRSYEVMVPDYGAFAERYEGPAIVCAVTLDVTSSGEQYVPHPIDVFVRSDDAWIPGVVLAMISDARIPPMAMWPHWSRWRAELAAPCPVGEHWWAGFWPQIPGNFFFVCADVDGPGGGRPMTKVAPGTGLPSGWQAIEVVFFPVAALGIGAEVPRRTLTRRQLVRATCTFGPMMAAFRALSSRSCTFRTCVRCFSGRTG